MRIWLIIGLVLLVGCTNNNYVYEMDLDDLEKDVTLQDGLILIMTGDLPPPQNITMIKNESGWYIEKN